MAIKKKESAAQSTHRSDSRKVNSSIVSAERLKPKQSKAKTNNPQKSKSDEMKEAKQIVANMPFWQQFIEAGKFLNEVRAESRKISWPARSQVIRETVSVLFLVALITFFVWSFDMVVGKFVFAPLEHWAHLYGIGGSG